MNQMIWRIFMSDGFRWFLLLTVMNLNFIAYYQDPTRYTLANQCYFGTPCKWFDYVAGMNTFTLDVVAFIGLWYTISPLWLRNSLPEYWFIPFIILGYGIITQITIDSPVVENNKDILDAPPKYLWPQTWRIVLYTIIMIIDILVFTQMYLDFGVNDYRKNFKVFDLMIRSRFGGFIQGNYTQFIFAWVGLGGVIIDILALYYVLVFNSCTYNLPTSWNF